MSTTKEKQRTAETIAAGLGEVRAGVAALRAELAELSGPPHLGWDGVSPETLERIAEADTKRAALPVAIEDGERRILELELELLRLRQPGLRAKIEEAYAEATAAVEEARKAQERADAKNHAWLEALRRERDLRVQERRLEREIANRKVTTDRSQEALAAPVVRSLWQAGSRS